MSARFIVKRRTIEAAARNPYRPRGQVRYGRWQTVAKCDTFAEAHEAKRKIRGLYSTQVFYRGAKLLDGDRVVACVCGHANLNGVDWREHRAHMEGG